MRNLASMIVAIGLAVAFTSPSFAAETPKTKADCEKAHMKWNDTSKTCTKGSM
jgi:hypothetical protein